jgi:hypothetical protein
MSRKQTNINTVVGQITIIEYKSREFRTVVIDPNGISKEQPTVGYGFRQAEKHIGIPHNTLSGWVVEDNEFKWLKVPSGKLFEVVVRKAENGQIMSLLEICSAYDLARHVAFTPAVERKWSSKVNEFVQWFNPFDFYQCHFSAMGIDYCPAQLNAFCENNSSQVFTKNAPIRYRAPEKKIALRLKTALCGCLEVQTPIGQIDLLTSTEIIEIKNAKHWKHAVGQVLMYSNYYPRHSRRIHLFGVCHASFKQLVEENASKLAIQVTWDSD